MGLIVNVKELMQDLRENGCGTFLEEVRSFCVAMSVQCLIWKIVYQFEVVRDVEGNWLLITIIIMRRSLLPFDHGMLVRLAQIYSNDFSTSDRLILKEQLCIYIHDVRRNSDFSNCHDLASLAVKMVQFDKHLTFPLVYRLIELALILPVATATVERAFSAMNIIKTDLRNKICYEWLNNMMVCYIEQEMFAKIDEDIILQCFQNMQNRRIQLPPRSSQ
ncbi:uncharacterized protein LOC120275602 [Dioscorea cayenensis subsp. rotundata]|uniref:Uncharacterized protein LOC120275602 n=1 Tax=Dioscorea cayennensis subsp. rotundata TaxID=55577 RepID=A0AB40CEB1_DIOCR|nr:uncharacterized protein LOC120275602 [Dioscorea cayenensis subsp. rotundata]